MDRKWWTLTAVCTGVFMLLLDITIVNVALPDIQHAFGASLSGLQWVIDAYALTLAALLLTSGSLADLFGRRLLFVIGTGVFTAGSLLCGLSTGTVFLSLARAGQGVGGAIMFATSLALLSGAFHGKERGVAFGVFGAVTGVAVAVGPVLGGVLTSGLSWRWIFLVNVPIGIAAIAVSLLRLEESRDPGAARPDWLGFVTFSGGLALLVFGLIRGGADGWGVRSVVWSLVGSGVLLVVFVVTQLVQDSPMFEMSLLRKPTFVGGLVAGFGVSASVFSLLTYLVIYVQNVLGYSAVGAGLRFLFLSGAAFVAASVAGRLTSHVPTKWLIGPGFLVIGIGLVLIYGITTTSSWTHLIPGLVVSGLGIGMVNVPLASTAVGVVRRERAGMASGVNSTFRQVGIATGIAALGSIFSNHVATGVRSALASTPLAGQADKVSTAVTGGQIHQVLAATPPRLRGTVADAATTGFVNALNHITAIAAVIAFAAGLLCLVLVRQRDFEDHSGPQAGPAPTGVAVEEPVG
ncbi:MAG: MFS transporter [Nocardioidaceae bacterium]